MRRRDLLKLAGGAAAVAAAPGLVRAQGAVAPAVRLPKLDVSPDRVTRTIVGLRPYRPAGFVVAAERLTRRRTVVHNYGHGGCGITLSWGTAALAVTEALGASDETRWAVMGAGVNGLTTALMLLRRGFEVTIYAEDLPPYTTSNIAAAVWGPATIYDEASVSDAFMAQFVYAARYAQRTFQHYVNDPSYGVRWIDEYYLQRRVRSGPGEPPPEGADLYPGSHGYRDPDRWFGFPSVLARKTLMIDPDIYLRALMRDVENAGGRIVRRRFESIEDVERLDERAVMNCTGLGSRTLFGDEAMIPVQGQLTMLLPQPEINYGYVTGTDHGTLYMFPRQSGIVLGGTHKRGEFSTDVDWSERDRMLAGHAALANRIGA